MFFHQVHAVNDFNHVDQIDLIEHLTVNGQLRVAVGAADFGAAALTIYAQPGQSAQDIAREVARQLDERERRARAKARSNFSDQGGYES